jgi:hypothetical protein
MCPVCFNNLIPIVYGPVTDDNLSKHKSGKIILAGDRFRYQDTYSHYCMTCLEGINL